MSTPHRSAVVVGHTSGIGAGIAARLIEKGWQVTGCSRSTGHDISKREDRACILDWCGGASLIVLNAHHGFAQVELLYALAERWRDDASKAVLCIGSRAPDWRHPRPEPYAVEKAALDAAVIQLQLGAAWRLMHLRPGYVDTPRVATVTAPKLDVEHVVDAAMWMIEQPANVLVGRVDIATR